MNSEEPTRAAVFSRLTLRQYEVVQLRAAGLRFDDIGAQLGIAGVTVKIYMCHAAKRMGCTPRALIGVAARQRAGDVLRGHSMRIKEWKDRHGDELSPAAVTEINGILKAMLVDWS